MNTLPVTLTDQWTLVIGFIMPVLVSFVLQAHWSRQLKTIVAVACCLAAAAVQMALERKLDAAHFTTTLLQLFVYMVASLKGFWGPLGVASSLEQATTLTKPLPTTDTPAPAPTSATNAPREGEVQE